nr:hypothetical protein [Tanacetum cinerariifolium]
MAAPGGANQIVRRVIDDLIEFSGETSVDVCVKFRSVVRLQVASLIVVTITDKQGRNELLEKIIGCVVDSRGVPELDPKVLDIWGIVETEANDLDHLVNIDNDNDVDDLGYESEVYLDDDEEDDENNHSNVNVVKRGITRLSKFHREYGKPDRIKLSKETKEKIKERTLKVNHGTDAKKVVLGKEKGGYARGVGSGVTYKRYFDLPRSRQASDERIMLFQSQLDNERHERQEKELKILNLSNKISQTEGMFTKLMNQLATQGDQLKSISNQLTPPDVRHFFIVDEEGGTPVVECDNDVSIHKSNGLSTSEKEMETRIKLPMDCYKVSIDTSLVDAACIPDVGNNSFRTVKDVVVLANRIDNGFWIRLIKRELLREYFLTSSHRVLLMQSHVYDAKNPIKIEIISRETFQVILSSILHCVRLQAEEVFKKIKIIEDNLKEY